MASEKIAAMIEEVKAMIEDEISGYEITILERTGTGETIKKDEIGLHSVFDGSLEQIIAVQEPWKWITARWTDRRAHV